ncbi:MAG: TIM barrel protein [Clostridia bacterium]|nr:TIM barrel protein [Clostridia bacterium]
MIQFPSYPTFGPGGNGDWFRLDGMKSLLQTPGWLHRVGLDAFEYEATRGVSAGEENLLAFGKKAKEYHIRLSLHTQYYISLSGVDPEKGLKSIEYIEKSLWAADLMGADTIVIHSGSAGKISREEAMKLSCDTLEHLITALDGRYENIRLGIETMGKLNQLGTLDEVIEQCRVSPRFVPVVDFGHLNCRERGLAFPDVDSYRRVFDRIANACGDAVARSLHCHFSKIEYTAAGEKCHLTFEDTTFGPAFEPLAEAIVRENLAPRIICESAGTQAEDALWMKNCVGGIGGTVRRNIINE